MWYKYDNSFRKFVRKFGKIPHDQSELMLNYAIGWISDLTGVTETRIMDTIFEEYQDWKTKGN